MPVHTVRSYSKIGRSDWSGGPHSASMLQLGWLRESSATPELVLICGGWRHVCETYYLALDSGLAPGDESLEKLNRVLVALLEQWRHLVMCAPAGGTLSLPFDFTDQAIGCLSARIGTTDVSLQPGWSRVEGWRIAPTQFAESQQSLADFAPEAAVRPLTATRSELLHWIEASLAVARKGVPIGPQTDPTPIFEHFRGSYGTELLAAAVAHFGLFGRLAAGPLSAEDLREQLKLEVRPATVLFTALCAMGLLSRRAGDKLSLTAIAAEHLAPGRPFDVGDYISLAASAPGVLEMVQRLKTNRPADSDGGGAAFIYRDGIASAMEEATLARHFTLALAGRARNVAPRLAAVAKLTGVKHLLDVGGGTGLYALACLREYPQLRATVFDRPNVLRVAEEFRSSAGLVGRLELSPGDMFTDPLPEADAILLSNVLHDWDVPECQRLIERCVDVLPSGGRLLIHDVFLNDTLDGPLPIALYSAALFTLTEGRAYSTAEFREWLTTAGLTVTGPVPTRIHCGLLTGVKR